MKLERIPDFMYRMAERDAAHLDIKEVERSIPKPSLLRRMVNKLLGRKSVADWAEIEQKMLEDGVAQEAFYQKLDTERAEYDRKVEEIKAGKRMGFGD